MSRNQLFWITFCTLVCYVRSGNGLQGVPTWMWVQLTSLFFHDRRTKNNLSPFNSIIASCFTVIKADRRSFRYTQKKVRFETNDWWFKLHNTIELKWKLKQRNINLSWIILCSHFAFLPYTIFFFLLLLFFSSLLVLKCFDRIRFRI